MKNHPRLITKFLKNGKYKFFNSTNRKDLVEKPRRKTRYSKEKAVDQRENKYNEKEGEKVWVDRSQDIRMRLLEIDWFQFEKLVAMIYESRGYLVKHEGGAKPDEGIDLLSIPWINKDN